MNVKCGSPYFKVEEFRSTEANTTINVSWIEFDWSNSKASKGSKKEGKGKSDQAWDGYPAKDQKFSFAGKVQDGQYLPPVKGKDKQSINGMSKKQADEAGAATTEADTGFGAPTWGFYDPKKGGFKAFGTVGQGPQKEGIRPPGKAEDEKCKPRKILVTVMAVPSNNTNTTNSTTTLFSFAESSGSFDLNFLAEAAPADGGSNMMTIDMGSSVFLNSAVFLKAAAVGTMALAASLF